MSDKELANALKKLSEAKPMMAGDGSSKALPDYFKYIWTIAVNFVGPEAAKVALSGIEKAGVDHNINWDSAESWQQNHPKT